MMEDFDPLADDSDSEPEPPSTFLQDIARRFAPLRPRGPMFLDDHDPWYWDLERSELKYTSPTVYRNLELTTEPTRKSEHLILENYERGWNRLPVAKVANHFIEEYLSHSTVILMGETGSGKSTQIAQILFEHYAKKNVKFKIVVTQPRRIAAMALAVRVQQELDSSCLFKKYGIKTAGTVAYKVRFDSTVTESTRIVFMTEGILLQDSYLDILFSEYTAVIIDEVHERSIQTDLVLGIVRCAQNVRNWDNNGVFTMLKTVVMTATGDPDKLFIFFPISIVLLVSGKIYPVQVMYLEEDPEEYLSATLSNVINLHKTLPPDHHILVFLTGQEEIDGTVKQLQELKTSVPIFAWALHSSLPKNMQQFAFDMPPVGGRKIVVATNIAETSVTIPGIKVVVDCGYVKSRFYMPFRLLDALQVHRTSKSQAQQRAGRAGRQYPGTVYRMYSMETYEKLEPYEMPEVLRSNLCTLALKIAYMQFSSVGAFPLLDQPDRYLLRPALTELTRMKAIIDSPELVITNLGVGISTLPLEPNLGFVVMNSCDWGVLPEVTTVIAMLDTDNLFETTQDSIQNTMSAYWSPEGDLATYLNIYKGYKKSKAQKVWCANNKISFRAMQYVVKCREQLLKRCLKKNSKISYTEEEINEIITIVFASSLPNNRAQLDPDGRYYNLISYTPPATHGGLRGKIHPKSALARSKPPIIIFAKLTCGEDGDILMQHCSVLDRKLEHKIAAGLLPKKK